MLAFLNNAYLAATIRMQKLVEEVKNGAKEFQEDELGVSAIVATIILILIVVLLAVIFWNSISEWLSQLWATITGKASVLENQSTNGTF